MIPVDLPLEFVRVVESAAIAAARTMGRGDRQGADGVAVESMRREMETLDIEGTIVIGEGERDDAPMLYIGEKVGTGTGPAVDIAVDPLEGTNLCATGAPGAIAVLAAAEQRRAPPRRRHLHGQARRAGAGPGQPGHRGAGRAEPQGPGPAPSTATWTTSWSSCSTAPATSG